MSVPGYIVDEIKYDQQAVDDAYGQGFQSGAVVGAIVMAIAITVVLTLGVFYTT